MTSDATLVIGANLFNHDSAIFCVDVERQRAFGMSTERVTRFKHDTLFPMPVVRELLYDWGIDPLTVRKVVVATSLASQVEWMVDPDSSTEVLALRSDLKVRYKRDVIPAIAHYRRGADTRSQVPFPQMARAEFEAVFPAAEIEIAAFDHHLTHAMSGLVLSGFEDPLLITLDGWGDGFFSKAFVRDGQGLREISGSPSVRTSPSARLRLERHVPAEALATGIFHDLTLGHFYSIITWLLGFEPVSDEGKVEALAAYAPPDNEFLDALRQTISLDVATARLVVSERAALSLFFDIPRLVGFVRRLGKEAIASAMQRFLEERVVELVSLLVARTQREDIVLSGGCAANVVLNMNIFERISERLFITPAMADDGTALGAAVLALKSVGVRDAAFEFLRRSPMPYFGVCHQRSAARSALLRQRHRLPFEDFDTRWPEIVAGLIYRGEIGAIYQGRMEWGPRALGNRSILANPCSAATRDRLNSVVKHRPLFQPFCPTIMDDEKDRLFERAYLNRHMTCAFRMREQYWANLPSAIHVDGTARVQFLTREDNPTFYRVLAEFKRLSGFGVLINTSFNLHGRTIVNTPEDAIDDFLDSGMDFLVLDGYLVRRPDGEGSTG